MMSRTNAKLARWGIVLVGMMLAASCNIPTSSTIGSVTYYNAEKESVDLYINDKQVTSIAVGDSYTDTESVGNYNVEAKAYVFLLDYEAVWGQQNVYYSGSNQNITL